MFTSDPFSSVLMTPNFDEFALSPFNSVGHVLLARHEGAVMNLYIGQSAERTNVGLLTNMLIAIMGRGRNQRGEVADFCDGIVGQQKRCKLA